MTLHGDYWSIGAPYINLCFFYNRNGMIHAKTQIEVMAIAIAL